MPIFDHITTEQADLIRARVLEERLLFFVGREHGDATVAEVADHDFLRDLVGGERVQ